MTMSFGQHSTRKLIVLAVGLLLAGLVIGILIGMYAKTINMSCVVPIQ